jgi:hypothetical protein
MAQLTLPGLKARWFFLHPAYLLVVLTHRRVAVACLLPPPDPYSYRELTTEVDEKLACQRLCKQAGIQRMWHLCALHNTS